MEKLGRLYGVTKGNDQEGKGRSGTASVSGNRDVEVKLSQREAGVLSRHIEVAFEWKKPGVSTETGTKVGTIRKIRFANQAESRAGEKMADRVGFEPTIRV